MFLAIIGAEAGYMGLRALATGGVYICGGITPKVSPAITWCLSSCTFLLDIRAASAQRSVCRRTLPLAGKACNKNQGICGEVSAWL